MRSRSSARRAWATSWSPFTVRVSSPVKSACSSVAPRMMRVRASESGEVVQLTRDQMHALIQTDAEMSEVLMRALIHRRLALVAQGIGDVLLIGSVRSAATLRIKEFLTRNGHPFKYLDLDRDADVQDLLDRFHVDPAELPVVICRGEAVLKNPSNQEIADHLGFNERIDQDSPARCRHRRRRTGGSCGRGLRGFRGTRCAGHRGQFAWRPGGLELENRELPRISNGDFRPGAGRTRLCPGAEVWRRRHDRERRGGADLRTNAYGVRLDDGATIPARTVIIATGARYRKPSLANLGQFEGAGVYYSATFMEEAQLCDGDEVIVVGGANSAGQAAVFLAQTARRVHLLVRSNSLSASMSRYLIRRIEETPTIQVRTRTEIVALEGNGHLERVQWRDGTGAVTSHDIRHVFLMTGAEANTGVAEWPCRARREGLHQDRTGPDAGRSGRCPMAARALTVSARNLTSGRVRRGRRSVRQRQARGIGSR